ncbi:hypothetical protein RJ640_023590 [Escallonia rubra]|uniref:DNA-directed RNA polymerase n=1 Tax=Escallonia rubra TaxID=112253 RepID=A0AA88QYP0_9ASTE|nr:hypothetical protein RJ640_023590 [Escallonia rubra]
MVANEDDAVGPHPQQSVNKQLVATSPPVDKFQLLPEFLKVRGLVKQHLDSFNYFVTTGIKKIVRANDYIESKIDPKIYLRYTDVWIGKPSIGSGSDVRGVNPHECRLSETTYAAPIYVNIVYSNGSHGQLPVMKREKAIIGRMPIMLRSCRCVLYEKDEEELARRGECPLDPGGYFVIKGTEKEFLSPFFRALSDLASTSCIMKLLHGERGRKEKRKPKDKTRAEKNLYVSYIIQASVTSSTELTKSKTVIRMEKEKIYLFLNQFTTKVPIMVVMKAMGMESDQEVVQMLGRDPRYGALLLPSIEECASYDVFTQQQALDFLEKKEGRALGILRDILVANVPVHENNFRSKCIYVAVMLRRMMEAILNKDAMDDKDYVGNKRLELSGQLISLLFEDLFKTMNDEIRRGIDIILAKPSRSSRFDISQRKAN